jgi:hypothetical protein
MGLHARQEPVIAVSCWCERALDDKVVGHVEMPPRRVVERCAHG